MNLLTQGNSKLKKDGIWTFSLPAGKTCPMTGHYVTRAARQLRERNYHLSKTLDFKYIIMDQIIKKQIGMVRIHDSGDFYDTFYANKWLTIAKAIPECLFYAYTKQVSLFKIQECGGYMPPNFRLIYSYGGLEDELINPETDRHARVFEDYPSLKAAGYTDASDSDILALGLEKKIGLIYHGPIGP